MGEKKQPAEKATARKRAASKKCPSTKKGTSRASTRVKDRLSEFEDRFCLEMVYAPNGATAARRAGTPSKQPAQAAYKLLQKEAVKARIAEYKATYIEKVGLEIESVYRYLNGVINFDIRDLYHRDGRLKQPHELDPDVAGVLQGLTVTTRKDGRGEDADMLEEVEYKVPNRNEAADKALKALGVYREIVELHADSTLRGILNAIAGQSLGPPGLRAGPQGIAGGTGGTPRKR